LEQRKSAFLSKGKANFVSQKTGKKHPRKPKGKFPAMFSRVLKPETLLLGHM